MSAGEAGGGDRSAFSAFVDAVCARVRFTPARAKIAAELRAHLEDRAAMLTEHGAPPEDAARRAVEAMGDPAEIGAALDKEHDPFWGWTAELSGVFARLAAILLAVCLAGSYLLYDSRGNLIDAGFFWLRDQEFAGETLCRESLMEWCETEDYWVLLTGLEITAMQGGQGAVSIGKVWVCKNPFGGTPGDEAGLAVTLWDGDRELPLYLEQADMAHLLAGDAPPDTLTVEVSTDLGEHRTVELPVEWRERT